MSKHQCVPWRGRDGNLGGCVHCGKSLISDNEIIIKDWCGNILFEGHFEDEMVDTVLDANRCRGCNSHIPEINNGRNKPYRCADCGGTGYSGDFTVAWKDTNNETNVYESINY